MVLTSVHPSQEKDQYNNEVVRLGRPLPVEYLLLDCPVSTPNEPLYTFAVNEASFPVANRYDLWDIKNFHFKCKYILLMTIYIL